MCNVQVLWLISKADGAAPAAAIELAGAWAPPAPARGRGHRQLLPPRQHAHHAAPSGARGARHPSSRRACLAAMPRGGDGRLEQCGRSVQQACTGLDSGRLSAGDATAATGSAASSSGSAASSSGSLRVCRSRLCISVSISVSICVSISVAAEQASLSCYSVWIATHC